MTQTMLQFHKELAEAAAASPKDVRNHAKMKVGEVAMQGDVYITKIKSVPEAWSTETTHESRQVALGTTEGSRHCAEGDVQVLWPASREAALEAIDKLIPGFTDKLGAGASPCIGPVVVAKDSWCLSHPEHAHHELPAGTYLVTYQLDRQTMRQVKD